MPTAPDPTPIPGMGDQALSVASETDGIADEEERGGDSTLEVLSYVSQMSSEDGT